MVVSTGLGLSGSFGKDSALRGDITRRFQNLFAWINHFASDHTHTGTTSDGTKLDHDILTNFVAAEHKLEAAIDHDALTNFVAAEHVTHTSIDHGTIAGLTDDDHTQYLLHTDVDGATDLGQDINGFTNTSAADLDALTTASGNAVKATVATGTSALVIISAISMLNDTATQQTIMGYRVSGATTLAHSDSIAIRAASQHHQAATFVAIRTGLTAGDNTFELTARVTANAGRILSPTITILDAGS